MNPKEETKLSENEAPAAAKADNPTGQNSFLIIRCPDCNGEGWSWQRFEEEWNHRAQCWTCEGEGNLTLADLLQSEERIADKTIRRHSHLRDEAYFMAKGRRDIVRRCLNVYAAPSVPNATESAPASSTPDIGEAAFTFNEVSPLSESVSLKAEEWTVETDELGFQKLTCNGEDITDEIGHPSKTDLEPIATAHNDTVASLRRQLSERDAELVEWKETAVRSEKAALESESRLSERDAKIEGWIKVANDRYAEIVGLKDANKNLYIESNERLAELVKLREALGRVVYKTHYDRWVVAIREVGAEDAELFEALLALTPATAEKIS